ncbi:Lrp/AsnC family transcriptional regulator [archaeon]|nr:Lrp/AsnC family transcriptional regulator [archaeon]
MDKTDERMIAELDVDPRMAVSQLAKKLRISQQVADYRLKRLFKEGQITKLGAIINLKSLGLEHYRVFFTFNAKKDIQEKQVFDFLRQKSGVYWAARIGGKYDLVVVLFVRDFEAFDNFIDGFNTQFPGLIKDYKSCYVINHWIYRHKQLSKGRSELSYGYNDKLVGIDELDRQILSRIKDDCRLPALELAKGKDVSYKTIINRIKSLEQKKVILGYRMFLKSEQQKPFVVLLSFKDYSRKSEKLLLSYLAENDNITQTVRLFGIWDLFLHIRIEDNERLQQLIIDLRDKFSIIDNYEIIPVFEDISINLLPA